jgi:hypothetical protein
MKRIENASGPVTVHECDGPVNAMLPRNSNKIEPLSAVMHALTVVAGARRCTIALLVGRTWELVNRSVLSMQRGVESRGWLEVFAVAYLLTSIGGKRTGEGRVIKRVEYRIVENLARMNVGDRRRQLLARADLWREARGTIFLAETTHGGSFGSWSWRDMIRCLHIAWLIGKTIAREVKSTQVSMRIDRERRGRRAIIPMILQGAFGSARTDFRSMSVLKDAKSPLLGHFTNCQSELLILLQSWDISLTEIGQKIWSRAALYERRR